MEEDKVKGAASALAQHSKDAMNDASAKAGSTAANAKDAAEDMGDNVKNMSDSAKDSAEDLAGRAQSAASQMSETVSATARKVSAAASDAGGQAYERATQATAYVGEQVKQRPLTSLLVGIALGYFSGLILHRNSSSGSLRREVERYRRRGW